MDAYDVLKRKLPKKIDEIYFHQLIKEFRESYFKENNYHKRLSLHRKPYDLVDKLLNGKIGNDGLYNYLHKIQERPELRHTETNISTYVDYVLRDIWENDKRVKTCFNAIKEYCKLPSKDFNTIAIHIAEYKAMEQVRKYLLRASDRIWKKGNKPETITSITENKSLNKLFVDNSACETCLNALRLVIPPVINNNNNYLLGERKKGAIVAWIEVLKIRGIIINIDKIKLAEILNNTFFGLSISSRTLSNVTTTAYRKYFTKLTTLIK